MRRAARPLLYLGIIGAVVGLSLYHARSIADPPYSYTGTFRFGWSLVYIGLLVLTAYGFGLPDVARTPRQAVSSAVGAAVAAALLMSAVQLIVGDALLPRFVVFGAAILLVPWYLLCVAMAGAVPGTTTADRAVVISDVVDPATLRDEVARSPERPVVVTSVVRLAAVEPDDEHHQPLLDLVDHDHAGVVVLDREAQGSTKVVEQAALLHARGIRIRTLSLFYDEWLGMVPLAELERTSMMFDIGEVHRARYGRLERLVDVTIGLASAALLVLAIPIVAVGDLVANRGRLFYRQNRVGKGGVEFEILKFRTMRDEPEGSDHAGPDEWTRKSDPRITPFGGLLRRTHLDELPQALNILRGDLAVVGPRPEQAAYVAELVDKLPYYDLRHMVRPGLTGWAQVKYGYAGNESDAVQKLQYDFWYLRHQSLGLDLRVVGRTIRSVLAGEGR